MKKLISLFFVTILLIVGCAPNVTVKDWDKSDFSFYENDNEIAFTTIGVPSIALSEYEGAMTGRGVKIGDRATTAIEKYKLKGYSYYTNLSSMSLPPYDHSVNIVEEIQIAAKNQVGIVLFVLFDSELVPFIPVENLEILDLSKQDYCWMLSFWIEDEKIANIMIEHRIPSENTN